MKEFAIYDSLIGFIKIEYIDDVVYYLKKLNFHPKDFGKKNLFTNFVFKEISEYLSGNRRSFSFKYRLIGTSFQLKVWRELVKIPYGETRNYKEIATSLGNENACRAVGNANNKNPLTLVVPCHRVIGKNGALVGYAGGVEVKNFLLQLEKQNMMTKKDNFSKNKLFEETIRTKLLNYSEPKYRDFISSLIPGCNNIIGVRMPKIREIAKEILKETPLEYLKETKSVYFEETMLKALILGKLKFDIQFTLEQCRLLIPEITNWSLCDTFCNELKIVRKHREESLEFFEKYLSSDNPNELRIFIVILLFHFVDKEHLSYLFKNFNSVKKDDYYVAMAVAWAISICFIKYPKETMIYLNDNNLDDNTYNKALQKICESHRVDNETKAIIRSMKRKNFNKV
ncbi:MAG: methylated-DNA--[protein]-cysteine S-methyltransferase [Synergistaceae bacterium]